MTRNALRVEITDEDLRYAQTQDKFNCAIVRAIQRANPDALRVSADEKTIRFTMPDEVLPDGSQGVRYIFETPRAVVNSVIRPFDEGRAIEAEAKTFSLTHAIDAKPMYKTTKERRRQQNTTDRKSAAKRQYRRGVAGTDRRYGRFLDAAVEEAANASGS